VRNRGEDAHEATVNITLPPLMEYLGTDFDVSLALMSPSCRLSLEMCMNICGYKISEILTGA